MKILLLPLLLFSTLAFGQMCIPHKDPFSGKNTKAGVVYLLPSIGYPFLMLTKVDTSYTIAFSFDSGLKESNFIAEQMVMLVKFDNGTIKKYHSNKDTRVVPTQSGVTVAFLADLPSNDVLYIKGYPMSFIRLSYRADENTGYDSQISKRIAKQIMRVVDCVTQ